MNILKIKLNISIVTSIIIVNANTISITLLDSSNGIIAARNVI